VHEIRWKGFIIGAKPKDVFSVCVPYRFCLFYSEGKLRLHKRSFSYTVSIYSLLLTWLSQSLCTVNYSGLCSQFVSWALENIFTTILK